MAATAGLRAARQGAGLTVESVEAAQDAFQEELDQLEEIEQALTGSGAAVMDGETEEDLVAELEGLLRAHDEAPATAAISQPLYDLPDISKLNLSTPVPAAASSSSTNVSPLESQVAVQS